MNQSPYRPPPPAPPHDPYALLLSGTGPTPQRGWRMRTVQAPHLSAELSADGAALVLAAAPGALRQASETSGSFGGRRLPSNVALDRFGNLYLFDAADAALKRFDPCSCRFDLLRRFKRPRSPGARAAHAGRRVALDEIADARAIAIGETGLFIADAGLGRVLRVALDSLAVRDALYLPHGERRTHWQPAGMTVDCLGALHVADPGNGRVDHFGAGGRRVRTTLGLPGITFLAAACDGGVLGVVLAAGGAGAARVVRVGEPEVQTGEARCDPLRGLPTMPQGLRVDAAGILWIACADVETPFDAHGEPLRMEKRLERPRYQRSGVFLTEALDSRIEGCQWHRIEVDGSFPPAGAVAVRTLCAPIELSAAEIDAMPDGAWSAACTLSIAGPGKVDCLVTSAPGRYLWLHLTLRGDGFETPRLGGVLVEYPRISLRRYLPAVFGADPAGADFTDRLTAIFDATLRSIERRVDRIPALFDPASAPVAQTGKDGADFLEWIAGWVGVTLQRDWTEERRRWYLRESTRLYSMRGTPQGLRRQLLLLLQFDRAYARCLDERPRARCAALALNCAEPPALTAATAPPLLLEHFKLRRWLHAGVGRLGDDSVLWGRRIVNRTQLGAGTPAAGGNARLGVTQINGVPDPLRDPFHEYAHKFSVFVPARVGARPAERRALEQLLAREAPAHTQVNVHYVEPRFRVGQQATIGLDAVVARTPSGVPLAASGSGARPLGQGTVLTGKPRQARAPRIGASRVGPDNVLD